jgi:hypothetical protein
MSSGGVGSKPKLGFGDIGEDLVNDCRQAARGDEIDSWLEFSRNIDFRGDRRKVGRQIKAALVPKAVWEDESGRLNSSHALNWNELARARLSHTWMRGRESGT